MAAKGDDPQLTQTIVQDMPIAVQESPEEALAGLPSAEQVKELMLLYQLCIKLLGCGDPNRVREIALEQVRMRFARLDEHAGRGERDPLLEALAQKVASRDLDPYTAADELLEALEGGAS